MTINIKKLLNTAYQELGYLEKESNKELDSKTNNVGSNNYTKYARDCFPELQGLAWCCMFVWWCFEKTFGKIMAHNLIGEKTAKCSIMKQRMVDSDCMKVSNVKEGDIVFFDRGIGISHIGIVYSIGDSMFSTIEGNTSQSKSTKDIDKVIPNGGGVFIRAYSYKNVQISDFIRPRWDLLKDDTETKQTSILNSDTGVIKATNVNIRIGAGTEYKVIGNETTGFTFTILGSKEDGSGRLWYNFLYKGQNAYICSQYILKIGDLKKC